MNNTAESKNFYVGDILFLRNPSLAGTEHEESEVNYRGTVYNAMKFRTEAVVVSTRGTQFSVPVEWLHLNSIKA
jgi:hypothetical protein